MFVFCLVIFFLSNGILVRSASDEKEISMLPFYSLRHAYNNSGINQADVESQLIALDNIAQRLHNGTGKDDALKDAGHKFLDLQTINSVAMSHTPIGNPEMIDEFARRPLYEEMTVYKSTDDVCLGFGAAPATHTTDVIIYSENHTFPYYLEQINLMLNDENRDVKSLEVYSIFVRRGMTELEGLNRTNGIIVARSLWVYQHNTSDVFFKLLKSEAEAYYLHREGYSPDESPDAGCSVSFNFTTCLLIFVIILVNTRL